MPTGGLAQYYLTLEQEMRRVHDGEVLRQAAADLIERLPAGPLTLITTSDQGVGLAAACACLRDAPTRWERIDLLAPPKFAAGTRLIAVEPVEGALAWRDAVKRCYPEAKLMIPNLPAEKRLVA
jgi:hypothetical protein